MMPDGNTAALARKMRDDDRDDDLMTIAEASRKRLVGDFIADPQSENTARLVDLLADLADDNTAFLHGLQRIHAIAARPITPEAQQRIASTALSMLKLFVDYVDTHEGDDLVNDEANRLARGEA